MYVLLMTINVRRSMIAMAMPNGTYYTNKLTIIVKSLIYHWQIIVALL